MKKLKKIMQKDEMNSDKFLVALVNATPSRDITTFINKLFSSQEEAEQYLNTHNKISESFKHAVVYKLQGFAVYLR